MIPLKQHAQHQSNMVVVLHTDTKTLDVQQKLTFVNNSEEVLTTLVLNDWNTAYSSVQTPLSKRFSDEFYRGFHLAKAYQRGKTTLESMVDTDGFFLNWSRSENHPDLVCIKLRESLAAHQKITLNLKYTVKIPSAEFTKYGFEAGGSFLLKDWFLTPSRFANGAFVRYSNENLDDIVNATSDFNIELQIPSGYAVTSDLTTQCLATDSVSSVWKLTGKNHTNWTLFVEPKLSFYSFKKDSLTVLTNLKDEKISLEQQKRSIDCVVDFVTQKIGHYPHQQIVVSQTDYERNPFYGLNQLPAFISPFTNAFSYEIRFLKTYLNAYLKNSLGLDHRKDAWIYDAIQVFTMMQYIETNHPKTKMLGSASSFKLLKSYHLTTLDFNEQYSYFYMLMARRNLDQALINPKNTLIKFNEQIASKYRAGLSLRFLDTYLANNRVSKAVASFYKSSQLQQQTSADFETLLKSSSQKNIDWFFETIINSRDLVDYKFGSATKTKDSVSFSIKNKTGVAVPVPVYGIYKNEIVFKKWLEPKTNDSVFRLARNGANKLVLNYKNEVPEYNLRNNWKALNGFFPNNRPIKFAFMKDLEDPYYNQILYVPTLDYNLYDGLLPGMRLHNKTLLEKPFVFDVNPAYAINTKTFSGSGSVVVNQNYRHGALYNVRYSCNGSYFHYAPDAAYLKINPMVQFRFRENDFRDNKKQLLLLRQVLVNKEQSTLLANTTAEKYTVFNAKYFNSKTEVTNHFSFVTDLQISGKFGKLATELEYNHLFLNNQRINLRWYAGRFLYNKTQSDYFSFALDRPTDYLFDYNYYGRSESTGFFSQQLIIAEGGFKSKLSTAYANQWITTLNAGCSLYKWIEVYGDVGFIKNHFQPHRLVFDTGIRLNIVPDYFEMYLPVYSSNNWEITQNNYSEKIRFIVILSPRGFINLFNRKWF